MISSKKMDCRVRPGNDRDGVGTLRFARPWTLSDIASDCMTDLLLGLASPEFWRGCGSALVALGVIGVAGVIFLPDAKRGMQKGLALLCIATLLVGLALGRFGESALLAEARERASVAELELTRLTTPRTLATERAAARRGAAQGLRRTGIRGASGGRAPRMHTRCGTCSTDACRRAMGPSDAGRACRRRSARRHPLAPNSGVTVFVAASRANELATAAQALAAALMAEGIIAGVSASAGPRMEQRPNVIAIEIGRKP